MKQKRVIIPLFIILFMIILNVIAWNSTTFSDFYVAKIFPLIMTPFSFLTGLFPFSIGEFLIKLGIIVLIAGILLFIILMLAKKNSRRKILSFYGVAALWIATYIFSTLTTNFFILYHCTRFSDKYFQESEHNDEQLIELYNLLVKNANELSDDVERDENGFFVLSDKLSPNAKASLKNISDEYPLLSGYYPDAKAISSDYFMSQNSLLGIYFPFSLEANYNPAIYDINLPYTVSHEFAHLKGFIQEDEAGFIAYIACINSDSDDFRYSACINALEYVYNEMCRSGIDIYGEDINRIYESVDRDLFKYIPEEYWEENEEKEIISTETVEVISDFTIDTSLKLNGVDDGAKSYDRMVNLLLDYYFPAE